MDNLNEMGLTELSQDNLEEIDGGLGVALKIDFSGILDALLETVTGLTSAVLGAVGGVTGGATDGVLN